MLHKAGTPLIPLDSENGWGTGQKSQALNSPVALSHESIIVHAYITYSSYLISKLSFLGVHRG